MNSRKPETVKVYTYTEGLDEYGYPTKTKSSTYTSTDMILAIYSQQPVQDIRYNDVEVIGLTKLKTISDSNQIMIGTDYYNILYVIPSNRYYQVLMKKA